VRLNIAVTLVFSAAIAPSPMFSQQVDVNTTVARAETAYYEARFDDATAMLAPLNILLDGQPGRKQEKIRVKLQLALSYIGLNKFPKAKALFSEIYDLDPQFSIDRSKYPSKVLNLAEEAKIERTKTADDLFEQGVEAYKRGDLPEASTKFHGVLDLNTSYEPARQYLVLIEDTVALSNDQIALRWHNQFNAGDYEQASESYHQLASSARGGKVDGLLDQMRSEYRNAMMGMVESWSRACTAKDEGSMARIRTEADKLLPDASIAPDSLQQMSKCAQDPQPAVQVEVRNSQNSQTEAVVECIQSSSETAMIRLKTRVEPELPAQMRGKQVRVRAAVRIDAQGNTTVRRLQGGSVPVNKMVVKALKEWKFHPAKVFNQARCVETELFVVVRPRTQYVSAQ
jgi:tetratricopeptide (TPR) repeat protein